MDKPKPSPKTHYLLLRIFAVVAQARRPITVTEIAGDLDLPADVVAHCIALHLYLGRTHQERLSLPPPLDYWVPEPRQVITRELLDPQSAAARNIVAAEVQRAARDR